MDEIHFRLETDEHCMMFEDHWKQDIENVLTE